MPEYLQKMGIERWCLRHAPHVQPEKKAINHVFCYYLAQPVCAVVIADAASQETFPAQLLLAMVEAMQQPFEGHYAESISLNMLPEGLRVVILLGSRVAAEWFGHPVDIGHLRSKLLADESGRPLQVLVTHGLAELQNNKVLKAETWQDLQLAMQIMAA